MLIYKYKWKQQQFKKVFRYVKLTTQLLLKMAFRKFDQRSGGKWLIRGTKHHQDNQLQSIGLWDPVEFPIWEYKFDTKIRC